MSLLDMRFTDRAEAGRALGEHLAEMELESPVVYALPRGGGSQALPETSLPQPASSPPPAAAAAITLAGRPNLSNLSIAGSPKLSANCDPIRWPDNPWRTCAICAATIDRAAPRIALSSFSCCFRSASLIFVRSAVEGFADFTR